MAEKGRIRRWAGRWLKRLRPPATPDALRGGLSPGDTVLAEVVGVEPDGAVRVDIHGVSLTAAAWPDVKPGDRLILRVTALAPTIQLQLVSRKSEDSRSIRVKV